MHAPTLYAPFRVILVLGLFLMTCPYSSTLTAQGKMEPGYYIDKSGDSILVSLKLKSGLKTPTFFIVREGAAKTTIDTSTAKAFGTLTANRKFATYTVAIPEYLTNYLGVSRSKDLVFSERKVVLEHLLDGAVSLLYWGNGNEGAYFIQRGGGRPELLVFRQFRDENYKLKLDKRYLSQLTDFFCGDEDANDLRKIDYQRANLYRVIKRYYECNDRPFIAFNHNPSPIRFKVVAGAEYAENLFEYNKEDYPFSTSFGGRIGAEIEVQLPHSARKNFIFLQAIYRRSFTEGAFGLYNRTLTYRSLNCVLGLRRHFTLFNVRSFVSGGALIDVPYKSEMTTDRQFGAYLLPYAQGNISFVGALGAELSERISISAEYQPQRNISPGFSLAKMFYTSGNINLSYRL